MQVTGGGEGQRISLHSALHLR